MRIKKMSSFLCWSLAFGASGYVAHAADSTKPPCESNATLSFDVTAFYRNVLSRVDNSSKEAWLANFDAMVAAEGEVKKIIQANLEADKLDLLARAVADVGYYLPLKVTNIDNADKVDLGGSLPAEVVALLSSAGQAAWANRFEAFAHNKKKNKYTAAELGIGDDNVEAVLKAMGKSDAAVAALRADYSKIVVNLYQQPFEAMVQVGKEIQDEASRAKWNTQIYGSQIGAVARKLILAEINRLGLAAMADPIAPITVPTDIDTHYRLGDQMTFYFWIYNGQYDEKEGYEKNSLVSTLYANLPESERIKDVNISRALDAVLEQYPEILDIFQPK